MSGHGSAAYVALSLGGVKSTSPPTDHQQLSTDWRSMLFGRSALQLSKHAFLSAITPISITAHRPVRIPLSAFIAEDMSEYVHAHATYRFVLVDEEEEKPRILVWLFKPSMRLSYATPTQYSIARHGSIRGAKVLFKLLGPFVAASEMQSYVVLGCCSKSAFLT